jgi:hypothetical protein
MFCLRCAALHYLPSYDLTDMDMNMEYGICSMSPTLPVPHRPRVYRRESTHYPDKPGHQTGIHDDMRALYYHSMRAGHHPSYLITYTTSASFIIIKYQVLVRQHHLGSLAGR